MLGFQVIYYRESEMLKIKIGNITDFHIKGHIFFPKVFNASSINVRIKRLRQVLFS